jgi:hypothetical protein
VDALESELVEEPPQAARLSTMDRAIIMASSFFMFVSSIK